MKELIGQIADITFRDGSRCTARIANLEGLFLQIKEGNFNPVFEGSGAGRHRSGKWEFIPSLKIKSHWINLLEVKDIGVKAECGSERDEWLD